MVLQAKYQRLILTPTVNMDNSRDESLTFVEIVGQPLFQGRLRVHRRQSNRGTPFNLVIFIDLAIISLLFSILFTRLVTFPGMNIDFIKIKQKTRKANTKLKAREVVLIIEEIGILNSSVIYL